MSFVDLKLNADGDIDITNYKLSLVTGKDYIAQRLRVALQLKKGEWFLDDQVGVPYFQEILGHPPDGAALQAIFVNAILSVPGVQSLLQFDMNFVRNTRQIQITFSVQTDEGLINAEELI